MEEYEIKHKSRKSNDKGIKIEGNEAMHTASFSLLQKRMHEQRIQ